MRKRLKVLTVGCKANFADSASVVRVAVAEGFDIVSDTQPADVVVINSCTVTHRADRDSRSHARRARRENPKATVILTGCYAQVSSPEREKIPEVDHWVGLAARNLGDRSRESRPPFRLCRGPSAGAPADLFEDPGRV
jgi:threonylcarbamoyladenosine tRNA methylthiotransferase MtaB